MRRPPTAQWSVRSSHLVHPSAMNRSMPGMALLQRRPDRHPRARISQHSDERSRWSQPRAPSRFVDWPNLPVARRAPWPAGKASTAHPIPRPQHRSDSQSDTTTQCDNRDADRDRAEIQASCRRRLRQIHRRRCQALQSPVYTPATPPRERSSCRRQTHGG